MIFEELKKFLPASNGLFYHMDYGFTPLVEDNNLFDFILYNNYGERISNNIILNITNNEVRQLEDNELNFLASLIKTIFKKRWDNYLAMMVIQYNKLNPYRMQKEQLENSNVERSGNDNISATNENEVTDGFNNYKVAKTGNRTDTFSGNDTNEKTFADTKTVTDNRTVTYNNLTDQRTDNLNETVNGSYTDVGDSSDVNSIQGFNSNSFVNKTKDDTDESVTRTYNDFNTKNSGTQTNVKSGSYDDERSIITKYGNNYKESERVIYGKNVGIIDSENTTYSGEKTSTSNGSSSNEKVSSQSEEVKNSLSYEVVGNIGNKTYQEMILSDINLWELNFVTKIVESVVSYISLKIYL